MANFFFGVIPPRPILGRSLGAMNSKAPLFEEKQVNVSVPR